jgi:hypothetical protein
MFNWLISPSKALAEGMEIAFAIGLFLTTLMVVVGLVGEYRKGDWWKRNLHVFEMLVVLGVAGEMITETGAFWYSLRLQAIEESAIVSAQQMANDSAKEAGNLGVTVDNLHNFVVQKESDVDNQFTILKKYVATEDARNASVIAELKDDKDTLDKARNDAVASVTTTKKALAAMEAELDAQQEVRERMLAVIAPRDLSDAQIATLGITLKQFSGQHWTVTTYWNSKEPLSLTNKIFSALKTAEWQYDDEGSKGVLIGGIEGVLVFVHPQANPRTKSAADALVAALNAERIGTALREQNDPSHPNDKLQLNIGSKP